MNNISVGDLVVVLRSHCGDAVGIIRTVTAIKTNVGGKCPTCGFVKIHPVVAELDGPAPWNRWRLPPSWLRRIPPLTELNEAERTQEEPA